MDYLFSQNIEKEEKELFIFFKKRTPCIYLLSLKNSRRVIREESKNKRKKKIKRENI
jgi:hypothetical protein